MKHFLVTDDQGNAVYLDPYFKEKSTMLCLPFAATQDLMLENFNERFTSMRCEDNTLFVFTQYQELHYMVVSDEGESVPFLKRQLQLIHELLLFHLGPQAEARLKPGQHRVSSEPSAILRPLVNTMIDLGNTQQSYLVQSIERLEVNDDLRGKCIRALEEALNSHKGHGAIHVLLFVGSKLVSHFAKPKAFELIPPDIFLISLLIKSLQDPSPPPPPPNILERKPTTEEKFVLAKEELSPETDSILSRRSSSSESVHSQGEPEPIYAPPRDLPKLTADQNVSQKVYLRTPALTPYNIYFGQVAEMTTMVVISDDQNNRQGVLQEMQQAIGRSLDSFIDFLIIKEKTHVTILPFLTHFPGLVHFIYVDRLNHQVVAPMVVSLNPDKDDQAAEDEEDQLHKMRRLAEPLKRKVWEMVACSQDRLSQGYSSMSMKQGDIQYTYNLWFEDGDGNGLTVDQPIPYPDSSYDGNFYREMTRRMFPNVKQANCFELYTLHLALVPQKQVVSQNRRLVKKLREGRPKPWNIPKFAV